MMKPRTIAYWIWLLIIGFFFVLMAKLTLPYYSFKLDINFLLTKQDVIHIHVWRWAFYTHITSSIWLLITGALQFSTQIRVNYPKIHRILGKIYVCIICILAAPSGFCMALYANGGIWAKIAFSILSILWFVYTYWAYLYIKRGNLQKHTSFMYKSYVLTLSAIILRLLVMILPHIFILPAQQMYTLVSWLSWVPSLLITELYFSIKHRNSNQTRP